MALLKQPAAAAFHVTVQSLAPEPFQLVRDIQVVIRADDDSFIATFFDANVSASGDTAEDAVANLKDLMIALFLRLAKEPPRKLGKGPAQQLAVLREFIRAK